MSPMYLQEGLETSQAAST